MACPRCGSETPAGNGLCQRCSASRPPDAFPPVAAGTLTPLQDPSDLGTFDGSEHATIPPPNAAGTPSDVPNTAQRTDTLAPGQTFASRYRIVGLLGQGGMGAVYQAWDDELGVMVALKVIRPESMDDPARAHDLERRFKRELLLARKISHKNVVRIHDLGKVGATTYLTMTYVRGQDLSTILKREGRLGVPRVLKIARQVASGLAAAHEQGVVHRDLKPANIMLDEDEHALILDFGIARSMLGDGTASGGIVGTLLYMAPEQARGEPIDARADIYAFGLILYDLLLGRRAVGSEQSEMGELLRRMTQAPPSLRSLEPSIPEALDHLITRCLQAPAADRYQSAAEVLTDLERLDVDGHAVLHGRSHDTGVPRPPTSPVTPAVHRLRSGVRRWHVITGVTLIAAVIGALIVGRWPLGSRPPVLSERDTVLLADFVNTTGEAVFDGALRQALAVQLEQSPFLDIFSDSRVRETLRYMGRSPDERVTPTVAREICERQGIKAMLTGSISPIGVRYVIDLNAVTCQTGESLAREQIEAANSELVLRALGTAASRLREKLGESLSSVQKFDAPIEQATTSSLEALKAFSVGEEQRIKGLESASIPFFKHAIELDPNFAMAYSRLAVIYRNLQDPERALEYMKPAMERRTRVTELEKLYITAHYSGLTGEVDQIIEAYELWKQLHPRDWAPRNNLAFRYTTVGRFDAAVTEAGEAARLNPNHPFPAANLGFAYIGLNRFDEAKAVFEKAIERKFTDLAYQFGLYEIAFVQKDPAAMARQAQWAEGNPMEHTMLFTRAQAAACSGRVREAADLFRRAVDAATRANLPEAAAVIAAVQLLTEAQFGYSHARERAVAMAREHHGRDAMLVLVTTLALARETGGANALADALEKEFPADTLVRRVWVPTARAGVELSRGAPAKALELLEPARRYELGRLTRMFGSPTPTYVRGLAYWRAGRFAESASEFQNILDHRGVAPVSPVYALALVGLARALGSAGDSAKALQHYQDFFVLWRDADADIPFLEEARRDYAKLQGGTPAATTTPFREPRTSQLRGVLRTRGETRAAASFLMNPRSDPRIAPAPRGEAGAH